jgi:hypothetical protein
VSPLPLCLLRLALDAPATPEDKIAGEITERLPPLILPPANSKHLSELENTGLVWRKARHERTLRAQGGHANAAHVCTGQGVPAVAAIPHRQRCSSQAEEKERANVASRECAAWPNTAHSFRVAKVVNVRAWNRHAEGVL